MGDAGGVEDREARIGRGSRRVEFLFAGVAVLACLVAAVAFVRYVVAVDGAARVSALMAGALVLGGVWLLVWSYLRRPPPGEDDDFLDKFLAGAGQALLLGAVLSFGFGLVGQQLDDERALRDLRREVSRQVRLASNAPEIFLSADLAGQPLAGLDLTGFDFAGGDLSGADLFQTNLTNANLLGADLSDADLFGADLAGADLAGADLSGAILTRADLTGAILTGADLTGADLSAADFADADLYYAVLADADIANGDLAGVNLACTVLSGADLTEADLTDVYVDYGAEPLVIQTPEDFRRQERLRREGKLTDLFSGKDCAGGDLSGADLSGADLSGADLSGVVLAGTAYSDTTIWPTGFDPPSSALLVE